MCIYQTESIPKFSQLAGLINLLAAFLKFSAYLPEFQIFNLLQTNPKFHICNYADRGSGRPLL